MTKHALSPRRKLWLMVAGACGLVLVGLIIGFIVLLSGAMSTAATKQHFALTYRILDLGLRYSVRTAARDIEVPPLDDPVLIRRGLACYRSHCAQCHGAPGLPPSSAAQGLLPIPTNLAQSAREWPPAWLYYVTKNGVRMTGMPAWGLRLSEQSLWSTVAFLRTLPSLTYEQYQTLRADVSAPCMPSDQITVDVPAHERGATVLRQYACDSCHLIEGVVGPRTFAGPPLADWPRRKYIAGVLPNTRANLMRWIMDPRSISPATLMPNLAVPEAHAREMTDYLFRQE